jgi:hypothetical protein
VARELSPAFDTVREVRGRLQAQCRKRAASRAELFGLVLVLAAFSCAALWVSQFVDIDATGLAAAPSALGFTMWSEPRAHAHPGFVTPVRSCGAEDPTFALGLAELKAALGDLMGEPLECERTIDSQGDTVQRTTTGSAGYVQRTQTVWFAGGERYWAQVGGHLLAGGGDRPQ